MEIKNLEQYINQNPKKYLIFDFDKTIVDLNFDWSDWHPEVARAIQKYDNDFKYLGGKVHEYVNDYVKKYGQGFRDEVVDINYRYENERYHNYIRNEYVIKFLKESQLTCFILSSTDSRVIGKILGEIRLNGRFHNIIGRDQVHLIKPDPEGYQYIIEPGNSINDYLMIGDSSNDSQAAEEINMDFYLIDYFNK